MSDTSIEVMYVEYDLNTNAFISELGDMTDVILKLIEPGRLQLSRTHGGTEYVKDYDNNVWYEIDFPIPNDLKNTTLYYDPDTNLLSDDEGYPMFNIFHFITHSQFAFFKYHKESMAFVGKDGHKVELIYGGREDVF